MCEQCRKEDEVNKRYQPIKTQLDYQRWAYDMFTVRGQHGFAEVVKKRIVKMEAETGGGDDD